MAESFGKFKLIEQIGGGRLSQVYRVTRAGCEGPDPRVALKRVHPGLIDQPTFVQLVVREAGLLSRLDHPALCGCQEMGVVDGCAFLTLDLVDGCTLRALMRRLSRHGARFPVSASVAIAHQLSAVLEYLHRDCPTPLVHLDLSPQNVMLSREGQVKLIDFGIARFVDGANPPPLGGKIAGTVGYMSPEQAAGRKLDARADQYGLGILLWEMLSGRRLFRGNTKETWRRMRHGDVPPVDEALSEVPESVRAVIGRLLAADPEQRYADMTRVQQALSRCISDPLSGVRPLAALVQRLMGEPDFDPFDVVQRPAPAPARPPADIPEGLARADADDYEQLSIEVDEGAGSPISQVRQALPAHPPAPPTEDPADHEPLDLDDDQREDSTVRKSPFLETIRDSEKAAGSEG